MSGGALLMMGYMCATATTTVSKRLIGGMLISRRRIALTSSKGGVRATVPAKTKR